MSTITRNAGIKNSYIVIVRTIPDKFVSVLRQTFGVIISQRCGKFPHFDELIHSGLKKPVQLR